MDDAELIPSDAAAAADLRADGGGRLRRAVEGLEGHGPAAATWARCLCAEAGLHSLQVLHPLPFPPYTTTHS